MIGVNEIPTWCKAISALVAMVVAGFVYMEQNYASRQDYEQHIADVACSKAVDQYLDARARAIKYPNDAALQRALEEARELKDFICKKNS